MKGRNGRVEKEEIWGEKKRKGNEREGVRRDEN